MAYDPEGPIAKQFLPLLANELVATFAIPDDAKDTAEYINVLIGQNKSALEICQEVKDVVNIPIDEAFMMRVFTEIGRLENSDQNVVSAVPAEAANPFQNVTILENPFQNENNTFVAPTQDSEMKNIPSGPLGAKKNVDFKSAESRKGGLAARGKGARGGISKDFVAGHGKNSKKPIGGANAANLQRALALGKSDLVNIQRSTRSQKGRCRDFPNCSRENCHFSHPFKTCFLYPNCKNPPGTCDYLHPDEDAELMQKIQKPTTKPFKRESAIPQVMSCKYGVLCSKELCPFGHPTPASTDAKVTIANWCRDNKKCTREDCRYAHSSPNYQAPATPAYTAPKPAFKAPAVAAQGPRFVFRTPTTLEQCQFGVNCTNKACARRHATSKVPCRSGPECTRMDCSFNHQDPSACRFGLECKNPACSFKHPDGREQNADKSAGAVMSRDFAVPEDQVMEQAVQQ